jgi:hypothetical protein
MANFVKESNKQVKASTELYDNNLILFKDKKEEMEIYDSIDFLIEKYAEQNNLSMITFTNKNGNIKVLYQGKSFAQELAKKSKEQDLDVNFILKIKKILPKNKKTRDLLLKLERLMIKVG